MVCVLKMKMKTCRIYFNLIKTADNGKRSLKYFLTGILVGYPKVQLEVTCKAYLSDHGSLLHVP